MITWKFTKDIEKNKKAFINATEWPNIYVVVSCEHFKVTIIVYIFLCLRFYLNIYLSFLNFLKRSNICLKGNFYCYKTVYKSLIYSKVLQSYSMSFCHHLFQFSLYSPELSYKTINLLKEWRLLSDISRWQTGYACHS